MDDREPVLDPELLQYATERQACFFHAVNEYGSGTAAAKALGVDGGTLRHAIRALKAKAAAGRRQDAIKPRGTDGFVAREMTTAYDADGGEQGSWLREGPEPVCAAGGEDEGPARDGHSGYKIKGVSTYYDAAGTQRGQWVKTTLDAAREEQAIRDFIADLADGIRGLSPNPPPPAIVDDDLLVVYPIGDPHFGMYAWKDETGADFDLVIAERITNAAMDGLVSTAPPAHTAVILNLGDMFHADNESNMTARSGNVLDVDARWQQVMQIGFRSMVYCIQRAREKHAHVIFRINQGNHDTHSSFALALALDAYFSNDPAVMIDLAPAKHWYFRWGRVLIGSTHGDTTKMPDLPGVMATDQRKAWGEADYCHWYCGHIHHDKVQEYPGCTVEYFRTLAARDAWHAGQGYRSGRDMQCIIHHRQFGEIGRHRRGIAMIEPRQAERLAA